MMVRRIAALLFVVVVMSAGCARFEDRIQVEILPEPELYELGMQKFANQEWEAAIAVFDRYERLYVDGSHIQEVRLKRADAQFNRNTTTSLILAKGEYESFLALYPRFEREDYVWLQIAQCSVNRMLPPNRDQSFTKQAITDLENFLERFPDSSLLPEARELLNKAYQTMAQYHVIVGDHYYGRGLWISAAGRYKAALELDVELVDFERVLYNLTVSLARASDNFNAMYTRVMNSPRPQMKERYLKEFEEARYDANRYLQEYENAFPGNTQEIDFLRREVNQIPPLPQQEAQK